MLCGKIGELAIKLNHFAKSYYSNNTNLDEYREILHQLDTLLIRTKIDQDKREQFQKDCLQNMLECIIKASKTTNAKFIIAITQEIIGAIRSLIK